jgi:hypothetical protein
MIHEKTLFVIETQHCSIWSFLQINPCVCGSINKNSLASNTDSPDLRFIRFEFLTLERCKSDTHSVEISLRILNFAFSLGCWSQGGAVSWSSQSALQWQGDTANKQQRILCAKLGGWVS